MSEYGSHRIDPLTEGEKAVVLDSALRAAQSNPAAELWVDRVLRNFLDRGRELPSIPDALADDLQITPGATQLDSLDWITLGSRLASVVSLRQMDPSQVLRVSVPHVVGFADLEVRKQDNARRRELREMTRSPEGAATWQWTREYPRQLNATISIGSLRFHVRFDHHGESWVRGWWVDEGTWRVLNTDIIRNPERKARPTGLFPRIDRCLKEITREFLTRHDPTSLKIMGADAKRNAHNVATYADILPDGYEVVPIIAHDDPLATATGVVGIEIVRKGYVHEDDPDAYCPFP